MSLCHIPGHKTLTQISFIVDIFSSTEAFSQFNPMQNFQGMPGQIVASSPLNPSRDGGVGDLDSLDVDGLLSKLLAFTRYYVLQSQAVL